MNQTLLQRARSLDMTLEQRLLVADAVCAGLEIGAVALDSMMSDDVNDIPLRLAMTACAEALRHTASETRANMVVKINQDMAANG